MTKCPVVLLPDGRRACRICGERPVSGPTSARCNRCIDHAHKKTCVDCGAVVYRKSTRCGKCRSTGLVGPAWKGGRTKSRGYVKIRVSLLPGGTHPRASNGYVLEHIVVMEEKLGRELLAGENVHHINGVKDDNRPENLELWVTKQPLGQRPEDLVAWAKEILELYG